MISRPHMTKVKAKNTMPELRFRKLLWNMGYRGYRIHYKELPGKPDVVFTKHKKAIFVHGCFWHGHNCRAGRNIPRSNLSYWEPKLRRNKVRDRNNVRDLRNGGWDVLIVWECEIKDKERIASTIQAFLDSGVLLRQKQLLR